MGGSRNGPHLDIGIARIERLGRLEVAGGPCFGAQHPDRREDLRHGVPGIVAMGAEAGRLPGRRAGQLHGPVQAITKAVGDIVQQRLVRPGAKRAASLVAFEDGFAVGEDGPPTIRAERQRIVVLTLRDAGARLLRDDHRVEQGQGLDPVGPLRRAEHAHRPAHGMARQGHGTPADDLQQRQQIVAQVQPVLAIVEGGTLGTAAVSLLVHRQDPQRPSQRRQDRTIRHGVEAVGVQEDHVDRPGRIAELQRRQFAGPAPALNAEGRSPGRGGLIGFDGVLGRQSHA